MGFLDRTFNVEIQKQPIQTRNITNAEESLKHFSERTFRAIRMNTANPGGRYPFGDNTINDPYIRGGDRFVITHVGMFLSINTAAAGPRTIEFKIGRKDYTYLLNVYDAYTDASFTTGTQYIDWHLGINNYAQGGVTQQYTLRELPYIELQENDWVEFVFGRFDPADYLDVRMLYKIINR
jgi:hypothetical protein